LVMQSLSEVPQRAATVQLLIAAAITRLDHEEQQDQHSSSEGRGEMTGPVSLLVQGVPYQVGPLCRAVEAELEQLEQPKTPEQITRVVAVLRAFTQAERAQLIQHCLELVEERDASIILSEAQAPVSAEERAWLAAFRNLDKAHRESALAQTVRFGHSAVASVGQSGISCGRQDQGCAGPDGNGAVSGVESAGVVANFFDSPAEANLPACAADSGNDSPAEVSDDDCGTMLEERAPHFFRRWSAPCLPSAGIHDAIADQVQGAAPPAHEQRWRSTTAPPPDIVLHVPIASSAESYRHAQQGSPFVEEDPPCLRL